MLKLQGTGITTPWGAASAFVLFVVGTIAYKACTREPEAPTPSDDVTEITTPNGKRGVYCKGMANAYGRSDRRECYQFVSKVCTSGYVFIRENDDAVMLECKPKEAFHE